MKPKILPRKEILQMHYRAMPQGRAGKLRLDFNENTAGCSPTVRAALRALSREQIGMYPEYEATRAHMAKYFRVAPEETILNNGVDDGLKLVFDCFVEPGTSVFLVEPTFDMYRFYSALHGARVISERLDAELRVPMENVQRALRRHKPRVFLLANPNNPTGTLLSRNELKRILDAAPRTLVVVDEAYAEFSGVTVLPWIRRYANLVVTRTFSKVMGLAGLRFGCLFANRALAAEMRKGQSPFPVNTAALVAAEAALRDAAHMRRTVAEVLRGRRLLENALRRLGARVYPSGGNFLLADFGNRAPRLVRALERQGILLRDRRRDFDRPGFIRITAGTRAQMRRLIRALELQW
ncbi:MAG TPA: histidinol-phosphate transaminase [Candidatus Acidoferrales bacterium]|jgi:histidinol-phosphate aminotransferase|nr:histidinol-phosphate transaminase [Candidatus Acidoferrales bacterium]